MRSKKFDKTEVSVGSMVVYNGGTDSYYGCTDPDELVEGKAYKVIDIEVRAWQTNYTLEGVNGYFNSCWFDLQEVNRIGKHAAPSVYLAGAITVPEVGKRARIQRITMEGGYISVVPVTTSEVKSVENVSENVFQVTTRNSIYMVQVG